MELKEVNKPSIRLDCPFYAIVHDNDGHAKKPLATYNYFFKAER